MPDKLAILQAQAIIADLKAVESEARKLNTTFKETVKQTEKINNGFNSGRLRDYTASFRELNSITTQYVNVERQLAESLARTANLERQQARLQTEQARTRRELAEARRSESRERQQSAREAAAEARANREATSAHAQLTKQTRQARQTARDYGSEMVLLRERLRQGTISQREYRSQISQLNRDFRSTTNEAIRLERELRRVNQQTLPSNQRSGALQGRVTDILKGVVGASAIGNIANGIVGIATDAYETVKALDAQNLALKSVFETEAQMAFQKEYLSELTNKYGLELVSTTDAYVKYSAAVKGTYLEGEQARKIFDSFSGASAKLGLSAEQSTGIFKSLEQMISKGKIQAEELRGQLGDRMAGAFKLFADGMGVSTAELDKMLKAGTVVADNVLPQVAERLSEVYNLDTAGNIDTIAAAQNRLKNEWTSFLSDFTDNKDNVDFLAGSIDALSYAVKFLLDILVKDGSAGREIVGGLIDIIGSLFDALGTVTGITETTSTKMEKFQATLQFVSADVNILASAIKYLTSVVSNFFSTMFEENGWDKFSQKMEKSADGFINSYNKWNKATNDADRLFTGLTANERKQKERENEIEKVRDLWSDALKSKKAYFQYKGFYYETKGGKPTGKSLDEYIDRGDKLEKKAIVKRTVLPGDNKPSRQRGSSLTGGQKDFLMILDGERSTELANLERDRLALKIGYEDYLQEKENIAIRYDKKLQDFLKGANAKEIKLKGASYKKAIDAAVQSNEKLYNERSKNLETNFNKEKNIIEGKNREIQKNQNISDADRLRQQNDIDSELIQKTADSYEKRIQLAASMGQRVLELERDRDEEIAKIEDQRLQRMAAIPEAIRSEIEYQSEILSANKDISYEKQRQLILTNKKLSAEERSYQLAVLDKQNEIKTTEQEIEKQTKLRDSITSRLLNEKAIGLPGAPTKEDIKLLAEYGAEIERLTNVNIQNKKDLDLLNFDKMAKGFEPIVNMISSGLNDLGLSRVSDQFTKMYQKILDEGKDFSLSNKEIFEAAGAVISDFAQMFTNAQKEKTIAALDEQLKYSQEATEQELGFINSRLEALNSLEELTAEQTAERNRLEDEARVYKDQQRQREKLIETQKARAEQKAAAQQALINGALAATMTLAQMGFIAGAIPAALALGFGIAQSVAIMSKDPVPKYWKGRTGGKAEFAITQDRGREIIAGEDGRIKSLGSDSGDKMTWLDKGDTVYTADETKQILKTMGPSAKIGSKVFQSIARESMIAPQVSIVNNYQDNSDAIAEKLGKRFDQSLARYDKPAIIKRSGFIYLYRGANYAEEIGSYDLETGKETFYS
ncbi:tape measure protein [Chryseobacterium aquifrigidense]|uniref:Tape measure domain-containing protein n=1 Tax=Chryseobacterium aquifrigidense TaxID=558021 RepID=A0A543E9T8_9FLAO|nr:tape measure protein [Chryseobacterium aquifrigidense]TQM18338.1 tape measure domain-containing protein [Chryseobacterium aquifrigidense]